MKKAYKRHCTSCVKLNTARENQFEGDKTTLIWESLFLSSSNEWAISTALSQIMTPVS